MSRMVVFGNDKLGRRAAAEIVRAVPGLSAYFDRSTNAGRVWKLLKRRSLLVGDAMRMAYAELKRRNVPAPPLPAISTNADLLRAIEQTACRRVYLFRAGLIVNKKVLATGVDILNLHCASLPDFGGLASIARALRAGKYAQCASLHRVEDTIDTGDVLAIEPYELNPHWPYHRNEDAAYDAGIELLCRVLRPAASHEKQAGGRV